MRRLLAALLLIVGLASASYALSPGARLILNTGCANGASVVLNFAAGTTCGTSFGALSVVRNSVAYEDDSAGNWIAFAANMLRRTDKGALIEEARTNSIRNNSMQGGVNNTTIPTLWSTIAINVAGLTRQSFVFGVENGIDYVDVRYSGTASGPSATAITPEPSTQIAAVNGQTWAHSAFVTLIGGSLGDALLRVRTSFRDNTGVALQTADTANFAPATGALGLNSHSIVGTAANASIAFVQPQLVVIVTSGNTYDFTLRYGWPQLELGSSVTSPIRTTAAVATRAADTVSFPLPATGSAISIFTQAVYSSARQSSGFIVSLTPGADNNRIELRNRATPNDLGLAFGDGTAFATTADGTMALNTRFKTAGAYSLAGGDTALSLNGATIVSNASGAARAPPTLAFIGSRFTGLGQPWNSYIERIDLWPNIRLPNATLQRLTAP